jgi:ADP-heptose:LPS heptosyltransferase
MAGGRDVLTDVVPHDRTAHTDENARRLIRAAARRFGTVAAEPTPAWPRFSLPAQAWRHADRLLTEMLRAGRPIVGLHPSGGRAIKQWYPARFGTAAGAIARDIGAAVVLTGGEGEQRLVAEARAAIPPSVPVADLSGGLDLLTLAAVLSRLDLYVTGDTGPMHLAAAMGVPVVGVFGISDPARYAPLTPHRRIVRIDLPCSPCNRVRLPPERCRGHVPDCLEGIAADMVHRAGMELFVESRSDTARARSV